MSHASPKSTGTQSWQTSRMPEAVPFKNVFVLCTGRCGSMTFAKACGHFSNFTVGHESRCSSTGDERVAYSSHHIEVDNRLAWFLGRLEEKYGDDAFYVHLLRDDALVAASYEKWRGSATSIVDAFTHGILCRRKPDRHECRELVRAIDENIRAFLRDKTHTLSINIDEAPSAFPDFAKAIGAHGDIHAAVAEFSHRHNASAHSNLSPPLEAILDDRALPIVCPQPHLSRPRPQNASTLESPGAAGVPPGVAKAVRQSPDRHLRSELSSLRRKLTRARKTAVWLAIPWILLLLPISVPVFLFLFVWQWPRKRRGVRHLASDRPQSRKSIVYDAFVKHHSEGPRSALRFLKSHRHMCPPGSLDLFQSMSATTDTDWLTCMNAWTRVNGLPCVTLHPGAKPRFHRIAFPSPSPVPAPEKVTVIMPAYNCEQTVEQAASSILAQSWENLELIIVDDCSTDGTRRSLHRVASSDQRVRILANERNVGPYVSKNRALQIATGRYVTGHDADDIAIPSRIADQMQPVLETPGCLATIAFMIRLDADGAFSYPGRVGTYSYDGVARRASISLLIDRTVLVDHLGFWDSVRFGADSEMIVRVADFLGDKLVDIPKIVMLCLNAQNSLTNHPEYGVLLGQGISPVRKAYRDAWLSWHAKTDPAGRCIPFPHLERHFAAPLAMTILDEDLIAVGGGMCSAENSPPQSRGTAA